MTPSPLFLALAGTAVLLLLLLGLGLSLQLGLGEKRRPRRWLHHVLFFAVCVGVLLSAGLAWQQSKGRALLLLPTLSLLLLMPLTHPGRAGHWQLALACAATFGLGSFLLLR